MVHADFQKCAAAEFALVAPVRQLHTMPDGAGPARTHQFDSAQLAAPDNPPCFLHQAMKAQVEAHGHFLAVILRTVQHNVTIVEAQRQRFLDKQVLAGSHHLKRDFCVRGCRSTDSNDIDIMLLQEIFVVFETPFDREFIRRQRQRLLIRVCQRNGFHLRNATDCR